MKKFYYCLATLCIFTLFFVVYEHTEASTKTENRNVLWKEIWEKKGMHAKTQGYSDTATNGYDAVDENQYSQVINQLLTKAKIKQIDSVCEFGCGSGVTLTELKKFFPKASFYGCDYSKNLIDVAKKTFPEGCFWIQDITKPIAYKNLNVDLAICYGVLIYLNSESSVKTAILHMSKQLNPNGQLLIGEVNDVEKEELANILRNVSHKDRKLLNPSLSLNHLYLSRDFFVKLAKEINADIEFIEFSDLNLDFAYITAPYRYNVLFSFHNNKES